jgi:hypothetical protein
MHICYTRSELIQNLQFVNCWKAVGTFKPCCLDHIMQVASRITGLYYLGQLLTSEKPEIAITLTCCKKETYPTVSIDIQYIDRCSKTLHRHAIFCCGFISAFIELFPVSTQTKCLEETV